MCILIDACTLGDVFNPTSKNHHQFSPVFSWIVEGEGHVVFGGTTYTNELKKVGYALNFITELSRRGKVKILNAKDVDDYEQALKKITPTHFNDDHLIAIIQDSGCRLLCSTNSKDFTPILDRRNYSNRRKPPKIYKSNRNASLLCSRYVADVCRPLKRLSKKERTGL